MAYKNIEDSRASFKRWYQKNKDKKLEMNRVRLLAIKNNPKKQKCSINGCDKIGERHHPDYNKPEEIIWLCRSHHKLLHIGQEKKCSIDGCDLKHHAKGYCNKHLHKFKRGKLLSLPY